MNALARLKRFLRRRVKPVGENGNEPDESNVRVEYEQLDPEGSNLSDRGRARHLTHLLGQIRRGEVGYAQADKFLHENGGPAVGNKTRRVQ